MTGHQITTAAAARAFMLAGKATLTLKSQRTGAHLTYRVTKANKPGKVSHFVKVRTGGEGKRAFAYLGFFGAAGFVHGAKSEFQPHAPQSRAFRFAAGNLLAGILPPELEVWHEGKCGRCARPLTDPDSIARGFGPECITKITCEG